MTRALRSLAVLAALGLLTPATVALAQPDDATIRVAKSHYEKGDAAYNLGRFDEAVQWFTKAYEAWAVPDFLYNIAQSYRQAGNCKQALFSYKRYLSLKDKDKAAPLSKKERTEIERFIKDLTECAAKADSTAAAPPDGLKTTTMPPTTTPPTPPPTTTTTTPTTTTPSTTTTTTTPPPTTTTTTTTTTPTTTTTTTPTTTTATPTTTATTEQPEDPEEPSVSASAEGTPKLLAAYATGGIAVFSGGTLDIPVQPSFAVGAGYPLAAGPVRLDVGARVSFSPIQYDTMDTTERASLLGVRATVGATYPIGDKLGLRGDLGLGIARLSGLAEGNPFTDDRKPASFTMLSVRVGAAFEYALTPNVSATVAPGFAYIQVPGELFITSLTQLDVLLGVGYRM